MNSSAVLRRFALLSVPSVHKLLNLSAESRIKLSEARNTQSSAARTEILSAADARQSKREAKRLRALVGCAVLVLGASAVLLYGASSARAQGAGQPFKDCPSCPEMVVVPPGSFQMGSPARERGRNFDEGPQRPVTIARGFAIGKYEVTRAEFEAFLAETGHAMARRCSAFADGRSWRNPGFSQSGRDPVSCVRWADAEAYVRWLSRKTGQAYRLPSEAEWEYAARAGTATARYWGEASGWGRANCERCGSRWDNRGTAPVGSFTPNAYGLHDVLGNNWEWVADCYQSSYAGAAADGRPRISGDCRYRVMRGGSWESDARRLRAANRRKHAPNDIDNDFGFRVARDIASQPVPAPPPQPQPGRVADDDLPWLKTSPEPLQQDIATLEIAGPNVTVNRSPASNGMRIKNQDYIATGPGSRARLSFFSGGYLQLEENTDPSFWQRLVETGKCIIQYALERGTVSGETGDCDAVIAGVWGNEILIGSKYLVTADPAATVLTILEGQATIRGGPGTPAVTVRDAEQVVVSQGAVSAPRRLSQSELRSFYDYLESYSFGAGPAPPAPLTVPSLVGLELKEAARIVTPLGLILERVGERSTSRFSPGAVVEQSPKAGAEVVRGTLVQVYVAVPAAPPPPILVPVPNVVGLPYDDAARILSLDGLGLTRLGERRTDRYQRGAIAEQIPMARTLVPRGTVVQVYTAVPPEPAPPTPVTVPNVVGQSLDKAKQVLARRRLGLRQAGVLNTKRVPLNTIADQDPRAGVIVRPGTVVDVYIEIPRIQ